MRLAVYIALIMTLIGCHKAADKPIIGDNLPPITNSIATLRNDIIGVGGVTIREDVVVAGRVTSDDSDNNFYGSIVVEDESGAVEVMIGTSYLETIYPVGLYVALRLKDCYVDYSRGVLQVGCKAPPYEYYRVGNLASREQRDRVVVRGRVVSPIEPMSISVSELSSSMCGRLINIRGLRLVDSSSVDTLKGEGLDRAVWAGYSLFKDDKGDSVAVYTREYARYSGSRIPIHDVGIIGILQRDSYRGGEECYFIKMRYEEDCTAM